MSLYLVRGQVDIGALGRWARDRAWGRRGRSEIYDEGLALHHLLAESFGKGVFQPFRLLVPPGARVGNLYGYARTDAEALRRAAEATMLPDAMDVLAPASLGTKQMPQDWAPGQRFGFDICLRPVVRLHKSTAAHGAGSEVDAFLAEALRDHAGEPEGMARAGRSREDVYADWLAGRLGKAATVDTARLVRFRRVRSVRSGRVVEGPEVVLQGDLVISDPTAFADVLRRGIGRHRAYGYGMILLRPQGTRPPTC